MSLDFNVVKTSLYDWASLVSGGVPVIFYNQNSPRPELPYITLFLNSLVQIGDDYIPRPNGSGDLNIIGDREFTLQVEAYGEDPITLLENMRSSLQKETILQTLRGNGIVFVQHNPILDITTVLDTEFEPRANMDVLFRIAQTNEDNHGLIETVEIDEEFSDGQNLVYSDTQIISAV